MTLTDPRRARAHAKARALVAEAGVEPFELDEILDAYDGEPGLIDFDNATRRLLELVVDHRRYMTDPEYHALAYSMAVTMAVALTAPATRILAAASRAHDGAGVDGEHHKQWALCGVAQLLGFPVSSDLDQGVAP